MKYVYVDENPYYPGTYLIFFNAHQFGWGPISGTLHILGARLLNTTYDNYLRICCNNFGAEIVGKKDKVPRPCFKDKSKAEKLAKIFEERLSYAISQKSVPND